MCLDRITDFDVCYHCGGIIEAGGDNSCICPDDDYEDYEYHRRRDEEAEKRTE